MFTTTVNLSGRTTKEKLVSGCTNGLTTEQELLSVVAGGVGVMVKLKKHGPMKIPTASNNSFNLTPISRSSQVKQMFGGRSAAKFLAQITGGENEKVGRKNP